MPKQDKHTLVVVDMQPSWFTDAGKDKVIAGCKRAIKKAMRNKNPIIFVEWDGDRHPTTPKLTDLTDGYKRAFTVAKACQDGSPQVVGLIEKKRLPKRVVRVCGVNTTACVLSTVGGLREKLNSTLHVLEDAVGGHWDDNWYAQHYERFENTVRIKA
jgi:nicotinamidase-related amidase